MGAFVDYYEVLQVHPSADQEVIDKAYRALILKYHPDKGGSEERTKEIVAAYYVIGDPARRRQYDQQYRAHQAGAPASSVVVEDIPPAVLDLMMTQTLGQLLGATARTAARVAGAAAVVGVATLIEGGSYLARGGYNADGFDRDGYGRDGYNLEGYNWMGFNRAGIHRDTGTPYNPKGFSANHRDRDGYDERGLDASGWSRDGYDKEGYDAEGYNRRGYDRKGYNRQGYNSIGKSRPMSAGAVIILVLTVLTVCCLAVSVLNGGS